MKLRRYIALLLTTLALFACGRTDVKSNVSLSGGVLAQTATNSVVRIASQGQSYCTGVLVAKDLVVTAAHCLTTEAASDLTVVFPLSVTDKNRSVSDFQKLREDSLLYFPNFDIAWIRLSASAPEPYKPALILGNSKDVTVGSAMTLVGTANDTPCSPGDADCKIVQLAIKLKSSWSSPHLVNLAVVDSSSASVLTGTCPGDSGGPGFLERNGQTLLYGIVAGKDPIFSGEGNNACGSPITVLTRVGEYQKWIEESSRTKLSIVEPAKVMTSIDFLNSTAADSSTHATWQEWFSKPLSRQSTWITVHKILEQVVLEYQNEIKSDQIPLIFQNGGQAWIDKLTSLRSLSLGFPDQAVAIDDLRPIEALKNLEGLTFLARSYKGLSTLALLSKLHDLTIIGRVLVKPEQGSLAWKDLASPSLLNLHLNQLSALQTNEINWTHMPKLQTLGVGSPTGKMPTSWIREERLPVLETLQIQEFSCDQVTWPKQAMPNLKALSLRSTLAPAQNELNCINWDLLPNLTVLSIQGYRLNLDEFTAHMPANLADQLRNLAH
ncbi:MAG: trypsin-like serine protease [Oligoflexus sp.]|nr:trypsin-like serine protease [Oligoflexus sp.]